jgi:hypothetical protein
MAFLQQIWESWILRFWFCRGVAAAMALVAPIPTVTDLSRFQGLRALHALILSWRHVADEIGALVGKLPFVPSIPGDYVNAAIFGISVGLPFGLGSHQDFTNRDLKTYGGTEHSLSFKIYRFIVHSTGPFILGYGYLRFYAQGEWMATLSPVKFWFTVCFILMSYGFSFSFSWRHLLHAKKNIPAYFNGMYFVAAVILTIELMYLLKTPWFTDRVNSFTCRELKTSPEECGPAKVSQ